MMESPDRDRTATQQTQHKLRLASLEADVAYFQARLEILGKPETANQHAQLKTYEQLRRNLGELILMAKLRLVEDERDTP